MAQALEITVGGTQLPPGVTDVSRTDELLWSEGTGRSATTGKMAGSVVAKKQTYSVKWGVLTEAEYAVVRAVAGGFARLTIRVGGTALADCTVYRGNVGGSLLGVYGGAAYYKDVSVELVEV